MDSSDYSPFYSSEQEVILQDGMQFQFEKLEVKGKPKKANELHVFYLKQV